MMRNINAKRVLLGGLVMGLAMMASEIVLEPLLASDAEAWLASLGLTAPGEAAMLMFALSGVILGITTIWLYAALRPTYGPGARTALMVGAAVAILACVVPNIGVLAFGILPVHLFWIYSAWSLVQVPLATIAGAWVYRDVETNVSKREDAVAARAVST